jgi:hypothetical protein
VKLFNRWKKRKKIREVQLRIDHCRSTIAEVHRALLIDEVQPEIAQQFHRLETALDEVDAALLNQRDLERIEVATNKLLAEFRSLYRQGKLKNIHEGLMH